MIQEINGNSGQVTQTGNVIVCKGTDHCALAPESKLQADFAARTGIWCPRGVREVFELLMADHGFTGVELARSWRAGSIAWNRENAKIKIVTPLIEAVYGWSMVVMFSVFMLSLSIPFVSANGYPLDITLSFLLATALYLGACWLTARFVLGPRRTAFRVRSVLMSDPEPLPSRRLVEAK